jgi:hypothetical protein
MRQIGKQKKLRICHSETHEEIEGRELTDEEKEAFLILLDIKNREYLMSILERCFVAVMKGAF